jgi:hypothetical protein
LSNRYSSRSSREAWLSFIGEVGLDCAM